MEKKIVYVVITGQYSDQSVAGVYDDKELAEKHTELFPDSYMYDFELNQYADIIKQGKGVYRVYMLKDGSTDRVIQRESPDITVWERFYVYEDKSFYSKTRGQSLLIVTTYAKDEQHAIKIANERRLSLLAQGIWEGAKSE